MVIGKNKTEDVRFRHLYRVSYGVYKALKFLDA
jgi:hypothetical protein